MPPFRKLFPVKNKAKRTNERRTGPENELNTDEEEKREKKDARPCRLQQICMLHPHSHSIGFNASPTRVHIEGYGRNERTQLKNKLKRRLYDRSCTKTYCVCHRRAASNKKSFYFVVELRPALIFSPIFVRKVLQFNSIHVC